MKLEPYVHTLSAGLLPAWDPGSSGLGVRDQELARLTDGLLGVKLEPYVHMLSAGLLPDCPLLSLPRASAAASAASSAEAFAAARRASRSRAATPWRERQDIRPGLRVYGVRCAQQNASPGCCSSKGGRSDLAFAHTGPGKGCCRDCTRWRTNSMNKADMRRPLALQCRANNCAANLQRPRAAPGWLSRQSRSAPPARPCAPAHWPPAPIQIKRHTDGARINAVMHQGRISCKEAASIQAASKLDEVWHE